MKFLVVALVIVIGAIIVALADKALGIDFSGVSVQKRIIHSVVCGLYGVAIAACIWFL